MSAVLRAEANGMQKSERRATPGFGVAVRPLLAVWLVGVAVLAAVRLQSAAAPDDLFLDATAVAGVRWYAGMLSSLGILAWTVAVSGCVATSFVSQIGGRLGAARAFRAGAVVLSLHLLDDLFAFHAVLLPQLTGLPKIVWLGALLTVTVAWMIPTFPDLVRTRWGLLVAGGAGLGASVAVDVAFGQGGEWYLLAEDGPKFLGILALASWSVMSAADVIRSVVAEAAARRPAHEPTPAPQRQTTSADR